MAKKSIMAIPYVCVIIINYNSGDCLSRCLSALESQTYNDFEVIVVDNNSTDNSIKVLKDLPSYFKIIKNKNNIGFASANNLAVQKSQASWIALLNPDAFPEPEWLGKLVFASNRHPEIRSFASVLLNDSDDKRLDGAGDVYHLSGLAWRGGHGRHVNEITVGGEVFSACAAAALYNRDLFNLIGGFDERYFCYLEDVDLGFRMRLRGEICFLVPDAIVRHIGSMITGRHSKFTIYHSIRNLIWTFIKNIPGPLLPFLIPLHALAIILLILMAIRKNAGREAIRALVDSLRSMPDIWHSRRLIQEKRTLSWWQVLRFLNWKPFAPILRSIDVISTTSNKKNV